MGAATIRQFTRLRHFDPEHLAETVRGGRFEHYILTAERCEVRHQRWACGTFSVDAGCYSFPERCLGSFTPDRACIGYLRTEIGLTRINGFDLTSETILYYPPGCEMNSRYAANNEWVAIEFEESALQEAAITRMDQPLDLPRNHTCRFSLPSSLRESLDALVQRSLRRPETSHSMIGPILGAIAEIMAGSRGNTLTEMGKRWRHRQLLLQRAEHYLQSNIGRPFDGRALALAVGTTERNLQIHFRQTYGITPGQWARCVALHRVRDHLLRPGAARFTVEGLAREFGFKHMGRFSQYYAELFGELPSETLKMASPTGA